MDRNYYLQEEEKKKKGKKRYIVILLLVILLMGVTVGYSVLSTSLTISGVSNIKRTNTWDVHFSNIEVTEGSVVASTVPTIDYSKTKITYAVDLEAPGDFYEFVVTVKNAGNIDAKLDELPILGGVSEEQDVYMNYTVSHADDTEIIPGEIIEAGGSEKFRVRIEVDPDALGSQMPTEKEVLSLSVDIPYEQA